MAASGDPADAINNDISTVSGDSGCERNETEGLLTREIWESSDGFRRAVGLRSTREEIEVILGAVADVGAGAGAGAEVVDGSGSAFCAAVDCCALSGRDGDDCSIVALSEAFSLTASVVVELTMSFAGIDLFRV